MRILTVLLLLLPAQLLAQGSNADSTRARPNSDPLLGDARSLSALAQQARQMQSNFERNRRSGLRFYNGGVDAECEVEIGVLCYWNNNGDVPPPAERSDAVIERQQLLELLAKAQAADPADDWVNGMRVRYALDQKQNDVAIAAARACGGTTWWCEALTGLALHVDNQHSAASAAFDRALRAMPADQRCLWTDLTPWLDSTTHDEYRAIPCDAREARNAFVFRMAQPLWMMSANDARNEWFARWTISRVHSHGRLPYDFGWSDDVTKMQVRYGWPTAWSIQTGGVADPRPPQIIGHEPTPSYAFMPSNSAMESPLTANAADWDMNGKKARMRYATRYATGFGLLPHQFARFKRGESTVIAGAYRLVRDLEMGQAPYTVGFVLDSAPGVAEPIAVTRDSAPANGAILSSIRSPMLASLEVLSPRSQRAARVRETVTPLPKDARISDLLITTRAQPDQPSLEVAVQQAYGGTEVDPGAALGVYWEVYRDVSPQSPLQVTLRASRVSSSFFQRFGSRLGLSRAVTPVSVRYSDAGRADGLPGRSLGLSIPDVPEGDYELMLILSGGGIADTVRTPLRVRGDR